MRPACTPPKLFKRFRRDESGTTMILFGLLLVPILFATAIAVDTARAYRTAEYVKNSLDAASLATAKILRLEAPSDSSLFETAENFFKSNMQQRGIVGISVSNFNMTSNRITNEIMLTVKAHVPTTFGRLLNLDSFDFPASSKAVYDTKDVELAMMLDVSGSMWGSKIEDLKASAKDLVGVIMDGNSNGAKNRIGIAPYSSSVNAGAYAASATGNSSSGNTCVSERPGANAYKDDDPTKGNLGKKATWCPDADVVPLTDNRTLLHTKIDAFVADGSTAGHLGIAWAWYIVSPNWASFWPSESIPKPYHDPETLKAVIVMTDGEFNRSYENANGNSQSQADKLCKNMKEAGVTVFSVAFDAPEAAKDLLSNCASSPSHYFDATDGAALRLTFQTIAQRLTALRLSQ